MHLLLRFVAFGAAFYGLSVMAADFVIPPKPQPPVSMQPVTTPQPVTPQPVVAELNDGSKVEFDADGSVLVLGANGVTFQAPDGTMTLKDGVPFTVKEGKRVDE